MLAELQWVKRASGAPRVLVFHLDDTEQLKTNRLVL